MTTFSSQIHCNQIGSGFFIYPKLWDSSGRNAGFFVASRWLEVLFDILDLLVG